MAAAADIRLWPIAVDGKYADVEAMEDGELDLTLFNGAVRNSENEHIAKLLRQKSKLLVAFGSCAHIGGIPGLANLVTRDEILSDGVPRQPEPREGQQDAAAARDAASTATTLDDPQLLQAGLQARRHRAGRLLRPRLPAGRRPGQGRAAGRGRRASCRRRARWSGRRRRALCDECPRTKSEKRIKQLLPAVADHGRPGGAACSSRASSAPDRRRGPAAARAARRAASPAAAATDRSPASSTRAPSCCRAVVSVIDSNDPEEIERILDGLPDFTGFAYRFSAPSSLLQRSVRQ